MASKILKKIKGILKVAAISVPLSLPLLGVGSALGSTIGTFVTKGQLTDYVHSEQVEEFVDTLKGQSEERFNNGEISEEEYKVALKDIDSKINTLEYADIVYSNDEGYQTTIKNYENCIMAASISALVTVGGLFTMFGVGESGFATSVLQSAQADFEDSKKNSVEEKEM